MKRLAALLAGCVLAAGNLAAAAESEPRATAHCTGDAALYLAYMAARDDAAPAAFPNDSAFRYLSLAPYIYPSDLLSAEAVESERGYAVSITLAPQALARVKALIDENLTAQRRQDFDALAGLALVVNGRPRAVIAMLLPPSGNRIQWRSSSGKSAAEAAEAAAAINCRETP